MSHKAAFDFYRQATHPGIKRRQAVPARIGPYRVESVLSRGGMSCLYLAIHPTTSEPIAIKALLPKYVKNTEIAARFLKEAEIIKMTNHPNIVKLYGQGSWERGLYIAMEFIQGVSLRQFIQKKALSHRRALEIILQVAYALCHLHTHGVVHRDLKPENILILESGEVKVIDFGIAQLNQIDNSARITQTKGVMGTPAYMSPEQKERPTSVSYPSDIYSLGIIAYELVLGRLSHGIVHLGLLPRHLKEIIEKALKPNPKERYQDIVDFITDISLYLKNLPAQEPPSVEAASEELFATIQRARSMLITKKAPRFAELDLAVSLRENNSFSALYLDFFRLPEQRLCIVLAEPTRHNPVALFDCANLRGMVRMTITECCNNPKKEFHPINMLRTLNEALIEEASQVPFAFSILLLSLEKEVLSFISCNTSPLWHICDASGKIRILSTPNPPLGVDSNFTPLETANNWHSGDTLIFHNIDKIAMPPKIAPHLSLQTISDQLASLADPQRPTAVVAIQRLF